MAQAQLNNESFAAVADAVSPPVALPRPPRRLPALEEVHPHDGEALRRHLAMQEARREAARVQ